MTVPVTKGRPAYRLYQLAWAGLDWLFPPICCGCGKAGAHWCLECLKATRCLPTSVCQRCGRMMEAAGVCLACQQAPPVYVSLRSWAVYQESLRKAILRLKFAGDLSLGELLARPMLDMLFRFGWQVDLVTPVPMGVARKLKRGYNQAALLALPLALGAGIAYRPQSLRKVRETPSQIGLGLTQRWDNVAGAFQAREMIVSGKSVLVVDDVTTSGATMQACAQALSEAGARQVYGLTLARTVSEVQPYDCFAA